MSELSDREIEEAAREAGISPAELRRALEQQRANAGALVRVPTPTLPSNPRGISVANAESQLPYPPEQAVRSVKHQIEREIGVSGHMMGSTAADIYDEGRGMIYRIQAANDGAGGSLVRVDVDSTPMRSRKTLSGMGLAATVGLFALSGLVVIPGLIGWVLLASAAGLGVLGATVMTATSNRAIKDARATVAHALVESEHQALPPGPRETSKTSDAVAGIIENLIERVE
jgi:hypothetical protein